MGEIIQVPFGEFKPDLRYHSNDGLVKAANVIPVYGNYITAPTSEQIVQIVADGSEFGLHVHKATGDGYAAVLVPGAPSRVHLYQVTEVGVATDRSRAATYQINNDFYGCSFGPFVVMTNYDDEVQFRDGGGVAVFANAITSTFAPRAKYCFPLRDNLFLLNCFLPGAYDTLAAGANPTLAAWSRNGDLRQFGSSNLDPQIVGTDFQPLNFDIGEITGGIAAEDYGIIACSDGLVRVDGPPYSFRVLSSEGGTIHPYGLIRAKGSVYYWGPSGLMRLLGGEGPPEVIGIGKFVRSLIDNSTGFSEMPWQTDSRISLAYDSVNDLIFAAYRSLTGINPGWAQTYLVYNVGEDRASYCGSPVVSAGPLHHPLHFLRTARQGSIGTSWSPGGGIRFLTNTGLPVSYRKFVLGELSAFNPVTLEKGYIQPKIGATTRFARIRPIYNVTDQAAIEQISVTIGTVKKPYATPTVHGPYTALDTHGWIVTPDTSFGDLHSVKFVVTSNAAMHKIVEYEKFEAEVIVGGDYGA